MATNTAQILADDAEKISTIKELVEGNITPERQELARRLKKFAEENQLSTRELADMMPGVDRSCVVRYLNGKYPARHSRIDEIVRQLLDRQIIATDYGRTEKLPYTQTSITDIVTRVCKMTQEFQDFGVICSNIAGVGKTIAVKNYARARENVYYIYAGVVQKTIKPLFNEIIRTISGNEPTKGHLKSQFNEIVKLVQGRNTLIILDECDHLSTNTLEALRQVRDSVSVGILLVGNIGLHANLVNLRGTYLSQLYSRVKVFQMLMVEITEGDVRALIAHYHPEPSESMVKYLLEYTSIRGFRMMENVMDWAMKYAQGDGRERFNLKDLKLGSNHLML